jgi:hypothetical protein
LLIFVIIFGFSSFCSPPFAIYSQTTGKHCVLAVFVFFRFLFILFAAFRYVFTYPRKNILILLFFVILFGFCSFCSPPFAIYSYTTEKHSAAFRHLFIPQKSILFLLFFVIFFGFSSFCSPPFAIYSQTTRKHCVLAVFGFFSVFVHFVPRLSLCIHIPQKKHSDLAVFCDFVRFLFILFPAFRYLFVYHRKTFCCLSPFIHTPEKHSVLAVFWDFARFLFILFPAFRCLFTNHRKNSVLILCLSLVGQFYALEYTCGQAEAVVSAEMPRSTAASSADYGKIIQELESHRQELLRLHLDYSLSQGVRILSIALSHVLSFPRGGPLLSLSFLLFSDSKTFTRTFLSLLVLIFLSFLSQRISL